MADSNLKVLSSLGCIRSAGVLHIARGCSELRGSGTTCFAEHHHHAGPCRSRRCLHHPHSGLGDCVHAADASSGCILPGNRRDPSDTGLEYQVRGVATNLRVDGPIRVGRERWLRRGRFGMTPCSLPCWVARQLLRPTMVTTPPPLAQRAPIGRSVIQKRSSTMATVRFTSPR